jgi:hypothetical protein
MSASIILDQTGVQIVHQLWKQDFSISLMMLEISSMMKIRNAMLDIDVITGFNSSK